MVIISDSGSRLVQTGHTNHSDMYALFPHVMPRSLASQVFPHVLQIAIALVHLKMFLVRMGLVTDGAVLHELIQVALLGCPVYYFLLV